jgi:hypothetical protein
LHCKKQFPEKPLAGEGATEARNSIPDVNARKGVFPQNLNNKTN